MYQLTVWAQRWNIPAQAIEELRAIMGIDYSKTPADTPAISEAAIQQRIRLDASAAGVRLWRNNNGATLDENGRMIRFGLGNDSAKVNQKMKSSDLIGVTPVIVTPGMIGYKIGVFTSIEVKRPGWKWRGTPRELAQWSWIKLIISMGGFARFATKLNEWRCK